MRKIADLLIGAFMLAFAVDAILAVWIVLNVLGWDFGDPRLAHLPLLTEITLTVLCSGATMCLWVLHMRAFEALEAWRDRTWPRARVAALCTHSCASGAGIIVVHSKHETSPCARSTLSFSALRPPRFLEPS